MVVGDGRFVRLTRFARGDGLQIAGGRSNSLLYTPSMCGSSMAKSDSFFIRAKVTTNGSTFAQNSVDLGAYVDALGKSVLRIHNIAVQYRTPGMAIGVPGIGSYNFQLTTQSQTALVGVFDKSTIASGTLAQSTDVDTVVMSNDNLDLGPQSWRNGYLIAVEQIYFGTQSGGTIIPGDGNIEIVMECTVETLSQSAAMALALSQQ